MKKILITIFLIFVGFVKAQKLDKEIKKDSIKTEVVEVITSYTPKVTDAEKIKHKPIIEFTRNVDKKKLEYHFDTAPVASTFVPEGVKMKVIDIGEKERIFVNYLAFGFAPYGGRLFSFGRFRCPSTGGKMDFNHLWTDHRFFLVGHGFGRGGGVLSADVSFRQRSHGPG